MPVAAQGQPVSDRSPINITMPPPRASAPMASRVESAIARASASTNVDFGYLFAQAKVESSLNPTAKAPTSSATGLFQFIESTWLDTMRRHGGAHGYGQYAAAIEAGPRGGRVSDPLMRGQILALRNDPQAASLMAGALAQDNRDALRPVLGREPNSGELYLAHFLGSSGAGKFLTALQHRPDVPAAAEFGSAARANRSIFYAPGGQARSFTGVMSVLQAKIDNAMPDGAPPAMPFDSFAAYRSDFAMMSRGAALERGGGTADWPPTMRAQPATGVQQRPKISDLLQNTFALAGNDSASGSGNHARRAYDRLKAFGL